MPSNSDDSRIGICPRQRTAIHEAGHAVAHCRLKIEQARVSIVPNDEENQLGSVLSQGAESVWSREEAEPMVMAYLAGYAALVAAGIAPDEAIVGAESDLESAESLISFWGLDGTIETWKASLVVMMSRPENYAAVKRVAQELIETPTSCGESVAIMVEIVDGECSEDDYLRWKQNRLRYT